MMSTVSILITVLLIVVVLIAVRFYFIRGDAETGEYLFGNIQFVGARETQSNYFSVLSDGNSLFAIIADGILDKTSGKYAAVLTVETFKYEYTTGRHKRVPFEDFIAQTLIKLNKNIEDHLYEETISLKFAVVLIENGTLHSAETSGNSVFLCRSREVLRVGDSKKSIPLADDPQIKISRLPSARNDVIMLASEGAMDSLTEMEILWCLSSQSHPQHKCQRLLKRIRQKRLKNQGNATIIVAEQTTRAVPAWDRGLGS